MTIVDELIAEADSDIGRVLLESPCSGCGRRLKDIGPPTPLIHVDRPNADGAYYCLDCCSQGRNLEPTP